MSDVWMSDETIAAMRQLGYILAERNDRLAVVDAALNPDAWRSPDHNPPFDYSAVMDPTKASYCFVCGSWEPRADRIVCGHCGHCYFDAQSVRDWAKHMEEAGHDPVPPGHCPLCGEAMS